jgi:hypothetical protein
MVDKKVSDKLIKLTSNWVQASKEPFTNHPIATLLRNDLKNDIEKIVKQFEETYLVNASAGAGNWSNVPWISILNPEITTTTQDGIYPVYLFCADGSGFYLSLNQGTTKPKQDLGKNKAANRAELIKDYILTEFPELNSWGKQVIDLKATTALGKSYEAANIVAKYYSVDLDLDDQTLEQDLLELLSVYQKIETLDLDSELEEFMITEPTASLKNTPFKLTCLSKPFLLLAGISGTGKTRFVREQAKATGSISETYRLIPVRPDWHEPSDILGYTSRLSGSSEYVTTEVLKFIAKAWRAIIDANGLKLEAITTDEGDTKLIVKGDKDQLDSIPPYWLCLDEMNLAPVEQYFADYLSILETREWSWDGDTFDYSCDSLLSASIINQVSKPEVLRKDLGFEDEQYNEQWALFCKYGMSIPFNLIVAGTVNMDETTHGFSRKVIDRALSFDFGEFFPNDFDQFFSPTVRNKVLSYPIHSQAAIDSLLDIGIDKNNDGSKSIAFLNAINTVLSNTPFELAYRALNELLLAVITSQPTTEIELQAVWDDFLMCKVLPRIEGDQDKLMVMGEGTQDISSDSLLNQLTEVLEAQLDTIWDKPLNSTKTRPDLFREKMQGDKTLHISCRSQAKIAWMQTRLVRSSFTSFWP